MQIKWPLVTSAFQRLLNTQSIRRLEKHSTFALLNIGSLSLSVVVLLFKSVIFSLGFCNPAPFMLL